MTISELIELLEDAQQELGDDAEVRLATQPAWPFEYSIRSDTATGDGIFYLAEAAQLGYLSGEVAEQLGWRS